MEKEERVSLVEKQLKARGDVADFRIAQIKNILEEFGNQGHSGFSAGYVIGYMKYYKKVGKKLAVESLNRVLEASKSSKDDDDSEMQALITDNIFSLLNLVDIYKFTDKEMELLIRLMSHKPVVPLTGADDEWSTPPCRDDDTEQNNVCSAVFRKNHDNSTAYYIDGKVFSDNGGFDFYTNRNSFIPVLFPFYVPDEPIRVYLNGEDSDEDISDNPERIKGLYEQAKKEYEEKYGEE